MLNTSLNSAWVGHHVVAVSVLFVEIWHVTSLFLSMWQNDDGRDSEGLEINKLQMACDMPNFNDIMMSEIGTILLLTHAVLKYE